MSRSAFHMTNKENFYLGDGPLRRRKRFSIICEPRTLNGDFADNCCCYYSGCLYMCRTFFPTLGPSPFATSRASPIRLDIRSSTRILCRVATSLPHVISASTHFLVGSCVFRGLAFPAVAQAARVETHTLAPNVLQGREIIFWQSFGSLARNGEAAVPCHPPDGIRRNGSSGSR